MDDIEWWDSEEAIEKINQIEFHGWADCQIEGWDKSEEFIPGWCKGANNHKYLTDLLCETQRWSTNEGKWDHRFYWYPVFFSFDEYYKNYRLRNKYTITDDGRIYWNRGMWRDRAKVRDKNRRRSRKEKIEYRGWTGTGDDDISGSFILIVR